MTSKRVLTIFFINLFISSIGLCNERLQDEGMIFSKEDKETYNDQLIHLSKVAKFDLSNYKILNIYDAIYTGNLDSLKSSHFENFISKLKPSFQTYKKNTFLNAHSYIYSSDCQVVARSDGRSFYSTKYLKKSAYSVQQLLIRKAEELQLQELFYLDVISKNNIFSIDLNGDVLMFKETIDNIEVFKLQEMDNDIWLKCFFWK